MTWLLVAPYGGLRVGCARRRLMEVHPAANIASTLRLITLVLLEQTEDWETERRYRSFDSLTQLHG